MEWVIGAVAAAVLFLYGRSHNWWGGAPALPPGPAGVVCDVESDMPASLKQTVLAQVASQKDPNALNTLAQTLTQGGYIQSAYCLRHQAWVLAGSHGAPPAAPTATQIATAQAMRQVLANPGQLGNLGQMTLNQIQIAPGTPNISVNVGTLVGIIGGPPVQVAGDSIATDISGNQSAFAITGPGMVSFTWSDGSKTTLTAIGTPATAAVAAASTTPSSTSPGGPISISPPAATIPPAVAPSAPVPGLDPNAVNAAAAALANLASQGAAPAPAGG